ncbi:hypothetical protein LX88_002906 [Lentzea californiensis]|nr:hypothetical protein [Lentzea californiensis]MCR3748932.1 hypothetical protein [Lentzea californiensis]
MRPFSPNTTKVSGPAIVAWVTLPGRTCTPYDTSSLIEPRSHGPVQSIPIRPELKRLRYCWSPASRYTDLSVTAMSRNSCMACVPASEANAAFLPSADSRSPPACHSSARNRHTVSSVPSLT